MKETKKGNNEDFLTFHSNNEKINSARHNISCFYFYFLGIVPSMESRESDILVTTTG